MNVTPGAAVRNNPGFTQGHQMLRNVSLPPAEGRFEVADAGLALANRQQDLQASRLADGLEQVSKNFNR